MSPPTPRQLLEALLPFLKVAAAYARQIQPKIAARPAKQGQENFFAEALSDADLSVQNLVEVALLGMFPDIRFYGEEFELSPNTKYFRAIDLGPSGDYLVTLDPIDGTQFYLDNHANYQIILSVLDRDEFAAVLVLTPAQHRYYYALRGEGAFTGNLEMSLDACRPFRAEPSRQTIYLGWGMEALKPYLEYHYTVTGVGVDYSKEVQIPNLNGLWTGELTGAAIESGKFIDGAALAFLMQEAGCIVTTLDGSPPPPLHACQEYARPGLILATSPSVHEHLLAAVQAMGLQQTVSP